MFKNSIFAGIAAAFLAMPVAADVLYECDITDRDERVGWLSPKVAIVLKSGGKALVIDQVTLNFLKDPAPARVVRRNGKLRVSWQIKGARDSKQFRIPTFRYLAVINEKTNAVQLSANPSGYSEQWAGRGTCKLRNDTKLPKELR